MSAAPPPPNEWLARLPVPKPIPGPHSAKPGDLLLHLGEAWYAPAPAVVETLATLGGRLARYPDSLSQDLREALALYCGQGVTAENIIIGNGSDGLIDLLVSCYAGPARGVAAPGPSFFVYGHAAALRGASFYTGGRRGQEEAFAFSLEAFREQLPAQTGVIFLANPNNPTGDLVEIAVLQQLAASTQALLVVDECYFEFAGETALGLVAQHPNVVILRSLSKSFALAGLRVGYAIAHPQVIETLMKADQTFSVNVVAQCCALAGLRALDHYRPLFARTVALRGEWTEMLCAAGLTVYPSRANILLANYSRVSPEEPLAPRLRASGIYMADFHERPGLRQAIRVSVDERPALERVKSALLSL